MLLQKNKLLKKHIESASNKCKAAWDIIKLEQNLPCYQKVTLDPDNLNNYFIDAVTEISNKIPVINSGFNTIGDFLGNCPNNIEFFQWKEITPEEVISVVTKLSNSKSMDYYGLSNFVVKHTVNIIKDTLAYILSKCLYHGFFSKMLKISKITPVFKKGDKTLPQNYRPISIVPIFSKIFESLIYNQLVQTLH